MGLYPVAEHALAHAVKISRMVGNEICLCILSNRVLNPVFLTKKALLQHIVDKNSREYNMPIAYQLYKGSIFTSIAEFVNENDASLVWNPWDERDAETYRKLGLKGNCQIESAFYSCSGPAIWSGKIS